MFYRKRKSSSPGIGCGFLIGTGLVIIPLFVFNNLVVRSLFAFNPDITNDQLSLAGQFLLPIGLLFVQFLFYDWLRGNYQR